MTLQQEILESCGRIIHTSMVLSMMADITGARTLEETHEKYCRYAARRAWQKLVDEAVSVAQYRIDWWKGEHPGKDPLSDRVLLNEFRTLAREIPHGEARITFFHSFASATGLSVRQAQELLESGEPARADAKQMPAPKRYTGGGR